MATVSFFIQGIHFETGRELPCSVCGVTGHETLGKARELLEHCPGCGGYGGVTIDQSPFILTVSDLMANEIVCRLRLGVQVGCSGSTSPEWVLKHLPARPMGPGHSYWLPRLRRIAIKAQKYRRWVVWHTNHRQDAK